MSGARGAAAGIMLLTLLFAPAAGAGGSLGEEARSAGKPLIVDFGKNQCVQCIEQAKTMEQLKATIGDKVLLRFVHVFKEEALAEAHKVILIPTLVFFDASGKEVFRNLGQMKHDEMVSKARELGLLN